MPQRLSVSDRDQQVLAFLDREGSTPMALLFWRFYATPAEQERKRRGLPGRDTNYKRGHKSMTALARRGFITIDDAAESVERSTGLTCSWPGCDGTAKAKGLCDAHYIRMRKNRPMDPPRQRHPLKICSLTDLGRDQLRILTKIPGGD
jgi:hypothetical protein